MEILSAIIQMLGGLAMFLYGIEVMGDGLKNSSGEALKRVLEKVTGNVLMGVITGTVVTAVIQSASAAVGILQALAGTGALEFDMAFPILMGIGIGASVPVMLSALGASVNGKRTAFVYLIIDILLNLVLFTANGTQNIPLLIAFSHL